MGAYMQQQGIEPELIVCSTATRTRQTLERALPYLPEGTEVVYSEDLYHASASGMARIAAELGYGLDSVMLVGHNPGSHFLALHLATSGDPAALDKLRAKFPTAGFAAIEFEQALADIEQGDGELVHFATPKSLV